MRKLTAPVVAIFMAMTTNALGCEPHVSPTLQHFMRQKAASAAQTARDTIVWGGVATSDRSALNHLLDDKLIDRSDGEISLHWQWFFRNALIYPSRVRDGCTSSEVCYVNVHADVGLCVAIDHDTGAIEENVPAIFFESGVHKDNKVPAFSKERTPHDRTLMRTYEGLLRVLDQREKTNDTGAPDHVKLLAASAVDVSLQHMTAQFQPFFDPKGEKGSILQKSMSKLRQGDFASTNVRKLLRLIGHQQAQTVHPASLSASDNSIEVAFSPATMNAVVFVVRIVKQRDAEIYGGKWIIEGADAFVLSPEIMMYD